MLFLKYKNSHSNFILVFCLDAKLRFDDNAEYRQKEVFSLRDWTQEDPKEVEASHHNLNYIALNGNCNVLTP